MALVTTHSPTALRNVDVDDLAIVRRDSLGKVTVQSFAPDHTELQKVLRSSPEAFLAGRVVLVEGATEYGFTLELLDGWNRDLAATGEPSSGALGVEVVQGSGNATIERARVLADLGYDVVLLIDSDVEKDRVAADALATQGVAVVRWKDPFYLERAATDALNGAELTALIEKAIELSDDPSASRNNYLVHLKKCGLSEEITTLVVNDWTELGVDLNAARNHVAHAAHKFDWFKQVHKGRALATLVLAAEGYATTDTASKVQSLRDAVFAPAAHRSPDATVPDDLPGKSEE